MTTVARKGGLLYPMLVLAAIAVIIFSATGIATMMGWLPSAASSRNPAVGMESPESRNDPGVIPSVSSAPQVVREPTPPIAPPSPISCSTCGVIESIRAVEVQGNTNWLGAAGGAVVGGLLGNQVGGGRGRTAATVVGAGAGAYAGNEIEKHVKKSVKYEVRVRMEDGTRRTLREASRPAYAVGQKVRVTDRGIVAAG